MPLFVVIWTFSGHCWLRPQGTQCTAWSWSVGAFSLQKGFPAKSFKSGGVIQCFVVLTTWGMYPAGSIEPSSPAHLRFRSSQILPELFD